ncbi:MAG: ribonuclease HI [Deltaproteobacteria bacterium]|nr:ribonuclease HI [Deltaproteobacteria bacterium]MDE0341882.1 ribonuclease HI [Deltaproteobacteria bacterium]
MKQVTIYTDGACIGNPGPGGYGTVLLYNGTRKELSGGYRKTTNNRMEIMAVLAGLRSLTEPCRVTLYSDSRYVVDAMSKGWAESWRAKGWRKGDKTPALNPDLWAEMLELSERHEIEYRWVKGHAGDPENERCDELAVTAARGADLARDEGYEQNNRRSWNRRR